MAQMMLSKGHLDCSDLISGAIFKLAWQSIAGRSSPKEGAARKS